MGILSRTGERLVICCLEGSDYRFWQSECFMDHTMIHRCNTAIEAYRPEMVRVLFIAESPPASGGFFYFPETIGKCLGRR